MTLTVSPKLQSMSDADEAMRAHQAALEARILASAKRARREQPIIRPIAANDEDKQ